MPRKSDITYEEIKAACQHISLQGKAVTWAAVRSIIGRGSFPVIQRHIETWRKEVGVEERYPDLPADVIDGLRGMVRRIREEVKQEVLSDLEEEYREIEQERLQHAAELADAKRSVSEANNARSDAEHTVSVLSIRVSNMEQALEAAAREKTQLELSNASLAAERDRMHAEISGIKEQLVTVQHQLEQANRDHEAEQQRAEQRYRGLEASLLQRHDLEKQPLRDKIEYLTKRLDDLKTVEMTLRQQFNNKVTEAAEARARFEQLQEQCEQLKQASDRLQEELGSANQRADRAEGSLAALRQARDHGN